MIGVHDCKVDTKGRILLPTALKNQLEPIIQQGFIIKRSIFQPCLEIHPRLIWEESMMEMRKLTKFTKKNSDFIRVLMAGVREIGPDNMGRILIPKDLALFAGISKDIVLASAIDIIEIWDKEKYEKSIAETQTNFSELAEEVMGKIN